MYIVRQCVKALVYYDIQTCHLDLQNDKGDTALHMAARWGYEGIIQVLLENGASAVIFNKSKESPLQCALNPKVSSVARSCCALSGHFLVLWRNFDLKAPCVTFKIICRKEMEKYLCMFLV